MSIYSVVTQTNTNKYDRDMAMVEKITKALSLNLPAYVLRSRDPRAVLTALFSAWIPLSTAVLVTVIEKLPSPIAAQATRMPDLLKSSPGSDYIDPKVSTAMEGLKKDRKEPLVAFVSKMVSIPEKELPENKTRQGGALTAEQARELGRKKRAEIARAQAFANGEHPDVAELKEVLSGVGIGANGAAPDVEKEHNDGEKEVLIGFARLFSGTLEVGDEVYVLSPKFSPANPHATPEPQKVTITALYLLMGRSLEPLTSVPAGVVFGVAGLEGHIAKSGTLCSQLEGGVNLAGLTMGSQPIVRVALEPENPADLSKMVAGLHLLQQSDPCAAYEILENGEHVILTAGELHLERCLKDLRERFAKCEIQVGEPIVPYRETIVSMADMNPPRDKDLPRGTVIGVVSSKQVSMRIRVRPLPSEVTDFLLKNAGLIRELYVEHSVVDDESTLEDSEETIPDEAASRRQENCAEVVAKLKQGLREVISTLKGHELDLWTSIIDKIVAFGPRRNGPNLLIDVTQDRVCSAL